MPNERDAKTLAKAKAKYLKNIGRKSLADIAKEIGIDSSTLYKWRKRYKWDDDLPPDKREIKSPRIASRGNQRAAGNHTKAKSNEKCLGNQNAYKTGLYAQIKYANMSDDEKKLIGIVCDDDDDPIQMQKCLIAELTVRESRMYQQIAQIKADEQGLVLDNVIQEQRVKKGESKGSPHMMTAMKKSAVDRILAIEAALSIVQKQKQAAISALHSMERNAETAKMERQRLEIEQARLELQKRRTDWLDPSGESESAKRTKAQEQLISIAALINAEDKPERTIESIDALEAGE